MTDFINKSVQKWNPVLRKYEEYELPKGCFLHHMDLTKKVACAQCGKEQVNGQCFTSKEVHNHLGLGYPVCSNCYDLEWERERNARRTENKATK